LDEKIRKNHPVQAEFKKVKKCWCMLKPALKGIWGKSFVGTGSAENLTPFFQGH